MTQMTFLPATPADMVEEYAEVSQQEGTEELYQTLIDEEHGELRANFGVCSGYETEELKEMADLIYVLYGYARVKGYNLDKAVERVHQNNMGRMYQVGDCTECSGTGYTQIGCTDGMSRECPACHGVGEHKWIERREDGKIMKNKDYPKVDLGDLV